MTTARRRTFRIRVGAVLLALGTVQFFAAHVVAQSAWLTPYRWATNYISDLGAVTCVSEPGDAVCSPLHAVMNTAFVLQGLALIGGTVLTAAAWAPSAGRRVWQGLVVAAGVSWIVVGLVPEDVDRAVHAAGALPGFVVSNAALLVAGSSTSTRRHRVCRRAALVLGIVGAAGFALLAVASRWPGGPVGVGAAERAVVFPLQIWALVTGVALLAAGYRNRASSDDRLGSGVIPRARPRRRPSRPRGDGPRSPS
jgi:hypothetical membrane protein